MANPLIDGASGLRFLNRFAVRLISARNYEKKFFGFSVTEKDRYRRLVKEQPREQNSL